jgi:MFS family permease
MLDSPQSGYRWWILVLAIVTGTFVTGVPFSCMPVLFKEIADDLGLTLVQIGTVWGLASLAGIFVSIIAGLMSDKYRTKLILSVFCILAGVTGALRGLSDGFLVLSITVFINGIVRMVVPISVNKAIGIWFRERNLGLGLGVGAMGMGFGMMLGPMISATVLSPALGGWRNVMYLYGALSVLVGIFWAFFGREPESISSSASGADKVPLRQALSKLIRLKALWLIGLTLLFRIGCIMGTAGYLPLYLLNKGWSAVNADGTLAAFYAVSTVCVVPLAYLSDTLGSRKAILYPASLTGILCVGLLPFVDGPAVWALIIVASIFMDGFISIAITMLLEAEGVGLVYSGTALGIVFTIANIGSVISPPLGNSLEAISPGTPFLFWASLSVVSLAVLFFVRETGKKR